MVAAAESYDPMQEMAGLGAVFSSELEQDDLYWK
jgi:hypothetical protein